MRDLSLFFNLRCQHRH